MKIFHMLKHWDWILLSTLIMLSFLPSAVFSYQQAGISETNSDFTAVISVDNQIVERITLTGHEGTEILDIPEIPCDTNSIELQDGYIRIKSSDCPQQICVLTGSISKPGQTVVCLHHRVVIEIEAVGDQAEDIIISH